MQENIKEKNIIEVRNKIKLSNKLIQKEINIMIREGILHEYAIRSSTEARETIFKLKAIKEMKENTRKTAIWMQLVSEDIIYGTSINKKFAQLIFFFFSDVLDINCE